MSSLSLSLSPQSLPYLCPPVSLSLITLYLLFAPSLLTLYPLSASPLSLSLSSLSTFSVPPISVSPLSIPHTWRVHSLIPCAGDCLLTQHDLRTLHGRVRPGTQTTLRLCGMHSISVPRVRKLEADLFQTDASSKINISGRYRPRGFKLKSR